LPLKVVLLNGAALLESGQFIERRVKLGPAQVLALRCSLCIER
jgi:hypothetical protein